MQRVVILTVGGSHEPIVESVDVNSNPKCNVTATLAG
jgi:hypothetical protein